MYAHSAPARATRHFFTCQCYHLRQSRACNAWKVFNKKENEVETKDSEDQLDLAEFCANLFDEAFDDCGVGQDFAEEGFLPELRMSVATYFESELGCGETEHFVIELIRHRGSGYPGVKYHM